MEADKHMVLWVWRCRLNYVPRISEISVSIPLVLAAGNRKIVDRSVKLFLFGVSKLSMQVTTKVVFLPYLH